MQTLQFQPKTKYRDEKYQYVSGTEGEVAEVEVSYTKGSEGLWGGATTARGIYFHVSVVKLERIVDQDRTYIIRSFTINIGAANKDAKSLLLEVPRMNAKKLREIAEFFDPIVGQVAHNWLSNNAEARAAFVSRLAEFKTQYGLAQAA
jgi:hypothetical protein